MSYVNFNFSEMFSQDSWNAVVTACEEHPIATVFVSGAFSLAVSGIICWSAQAVWLRCCPSQAFQQPHRFRQWGDYEISFLVSKRDVDTLQMDSDAYNLSLRILESVPSEADQEAITRIRDNGRINDSVRVLHSDSIAYPPLLLQAACHGNTPWIDLLIKKGATPANASPEDVLKWIRHALIYIEEIENMQPRNEGHDPYRDVYIPAIRGLIGILSEYGFDLNEMLMEEKRPLYAIDSTHDGRFFEAFIAAGLNPLLPETDEPGARNFLEFHFSEQWSFIENRSAQILERVVDYEGHEQMSLSRDFLAKRLVEESEWNGVVDRTIDWPFLAFIDDLLGNYPWLFKRENLPGPVISSRIFFEHIVPKMEELHQGDPKALHEALRIEGINVKRLLIGCFERTDPNFRYAREEVERVLNLYEKQMGTDEVDILVRALSLSDFLELVGDNFFLKKCVSPQTLQIILSDQNKQNEIANSPHVLARFFHIFQEATDSSMFFEAGARLSPKVFEEVMDIFICGDDNNQIDGVFPSQAKGAQDFVTMRRQFSPERVQKWVDILRPMIPVEEARGSTL